MEEVLTALTLAGFVFLKGEKAVQAKAFIESGGLGELLEQDDAGTKVYDVKAKNVHISTSTSKGMSPIPPHTDGVYLEDPPEWLALYGVDMDADETCRTYLAPAVSVYKAMSETQRNIVQLPDPDLPNFKYSYNLAIRGTLVIDDLADAKTQAKDETLPETVRASSAALIECFHVHAESFMLKPESILIFNNKKFLHSRDHVSSPRRHLLRYWINPVKEA